MSDDEIRREYTIKRAELDEQWYERAGSDTMPDYRLVEIVDCLESEYDKRALWN